MAGETRLEKKRGRESEDEDASQEPKRPRLHSPSISRGATPTEQPRTPEGTVGDVAELPLKQDTSAASQDRSTSSTKTGREPLEELDPNIHLHGDSGYGTASIQAKVSAKPKAQAVESTTKSTSSRVPREDPKLILPNHLQGLDTSSMAPELILYLQQLQRSEAERAIDNARYIALQVAHQQHVDAAAAEKAVMQATIKAEQKRGDQYKEDLCDLQILYDKKVQNEADEKDARYRRPLRGPDGVIDCLGILRIGMIVYVWWHCGGKGVVLRPWIVNGIDCDHTFMPKLDLLSPETLNQQGRPGGWSDEHKHLSALVVEDREAELANDTQEPGVLFEVERYRHRACEGRHKAEPPLKVPSFIDLTSRHKVDASQVVDVHLGWHVNPKHLAEINRRRPDPTQQMLEFIADVDAGRQPDDRNLYQRVRAKETRQGNHRRPQAPRAVNGGRAAPPAPIPQPLGPPQHHQAQHVQYQTPTAPQARRLAANGGRLAQPPQIPQQRGPPPPPPAQHVQYPPPPAMPMGRPAANGGPNGRGRPPRNQVQQNHHPTPAARPPGRPRR